MKAILVTFLFLQLVILNEALRLVRPKPRYCPQSKELLALKKALGLTTGASSLPQTRRSRRKRAIVQFPINCFHAAIVELNDGHAYLHPDILKCCKQKCDFPEFSGCMWGTRRKPYWLCASRAHQCICDCRETSLGASARKRVRGRTSGGSKPSASVCRRTSCNKYRRGRCCIENKCIRLYVHQTKSPVQPYDARRYVPIGK